MVHRAIESLRHLAASHRTATSGLAGALMIGMAAMLLVVARSKKLPPDQIEQGRRTSLMEIGKAVQGRVIDSGDNLPEGTVLYTYRVGGVEYQCSQDLSFLGEIASDFRADAQVQVRYDPENPFNSIVASEDWSGLWR